MTWKRARTPEQKQQRRAEIVAAAAELLKDHDLQDVSLNAIARETGLAKSNIYRYFKTREEVFLSLLSNDIAAAAAEGARLIDELPDSPTAEQIAAVLVQSMAGTPRLVALLGQLTSVIERNVSVEALIAFKLDAKAQVQQQSIALSERVSWLGPEDALQLTFFMISLIQGLWPIHRLSGVVAKAMEHPDLQGLHIPFEVALHRATALILKGLAAERAQ